MIISFMIKCLNRLKNACMSEESDSNYCIYKKKLYLCSRNSINLINA